MGIGAGVHTSCRQHAVKVSAGPPAAAVAVLALHQLPSPRSFVSADRTAGTPVATLRIGGEE